MYLSPEQAKQKILEEKYNGIKGDAYRTDCARIDAYEPHEYVLGYADFLDCRIDLSQRPMVPRDETAFWVARVIEELKGAGPLNALDLYAGSGNIGIALLKHLPEIQVTFSELDEKLLVGIEKSLGLNTIDPSRATLVAGDGLTKVSSTYDVICANPPYLDPTGEADMDPEMRYEPRVAFFGSSDGYGHHRELIKEGKKYLTERGVLYVQCDMTQAEELKRILATTDWTWEFWNDPYGHEGVMVLRNRHV